MLLAGLRDRVVSIHSDIGGCLEPSTVPGTHSVRPCMVGALSDRALVHLQAWQLGCAVSSRGGICSGCLLLFLLQLGSEALPRAIVSIPLLQQLLFRQGFHLSR